MSQTVALIEEWAAASSDHEMERVAALFTEDCEYEDVAVGHISRSRQEIIDFGAVFFTGFPDVVFKLTSAPVYNDHHAAVEWRMIGTHKGDMPGMPPANGGTCDVRGMSFMELRDGKIARCSDYWNMAELLRQLGHIS
jgi:steroid delta-isomerase-like uncharacterized protein